MPTDTPAVNQLNMAPKCTCLFSSRTLMQRTRKEVSGLGLACRLLYPSARPLRGCGVTEGPKNKEGTGPVRSWTRVRYVGKGVTC